MLAASIPQSLSRFHDSEERAIAFSSRGEILLRRIEFYRDIEDPSRRDKTEGVFQYKDPTELRFGQPMLSSGSSLNRTFIFCLSMPDVDRNAHPEWEYETVISNLRDFIADFENSLRKCAKEKVSIDFGPVEYNKGETISANPSIYDLLRLAWIQKPREHSSEAEFRIAARMNFASEAEAGEVFLFHLSSSPSYTRIMKIH